MYHAAESSLISKGVLDLFLQPINVFKWWGKSISGIEKMYKSIFVQWLYDWTLILYCMCILITEAFLISVEENNLYSSTIRVFCVLSAHINISDK